MALNFLDFILGEIKLEIVDSSFHKVEDPTFDNAGKTLEKIIRLKNL
jgi:hypothetical protein